MRNGKLQYLTTIALDAFWFAVVACVWASIYFVANLKAIE